MNNKSKNKLLILSVLVIVAVILVMCVIVKNSNNKESNKLSNSANKTSVEKAKSYRMDLRIYGTYNNKGINKIIMVNNYKNTDKDISITVDGKEEKYLVKDNKKYKVENEKLSSAENVLFTNTEVYLDGVSKMKNLKEEKEQKIGNNTYKVYKGIISINDMSSILKESGISIKTDKDIETEVWLTSDNYVYKVYYKLDKLTIYASYFGYGNMNKVNLDMYK